MAWRSGQAGRYGAIRLVPLQQLEVSAANPRGWRATGDDPQFLAETRFSPGGLLTVRGTASVEVHVVAYVDSGAGFSEQGAIALGSLGPAVTTLSAQLPDHVRALRLDPADRACELELLEVRLGRKLPQAGGERLKRLAQIVRERGVRGLAGAVARRVLRQVHGAPGPRRSYADWLQQKTPGEHELARQSASARTLAWQPEIDVLILRAPGDASAYRRTEESLRRQSYPRHRVISAEGSSAAQAWNAAVAAGRGELLLFLESGDELASHCLFAVASCGDPAAGLYYADEDRASVNGAVSPRFKPEWSPEALFSGDWVGGPTFIRRHLFEHAKGFRPTAGAERLDLLLRLPPGFRARRVPDVLLHRRAEAGQLSDDALRGVLQDYVRRTPGLDWTIAGSGEPRILYAPSEPARVSVIIPIRDKIELLRNCIASIDAHPCRASLEIIVVDNGSVEPATREYLAALRSRPALQVIADSRPFNWSAINNAAARRASGTYLLFLNNDIEVRDDGWVDAMLAFASRSEIGMVGAQLLYPDNTLQHYGVVLGLTGFAGHLLTGASPDDSSVLGSARSIRNCTAVTGACMLLRRELFESLGGFDESFEICGSDVEICLRALKAGLRNVVTPHARLTHFESKTRGRDVPKNDYQRSFVAYEPWLRNGDAYYSPHLSLKKVEPELRFEPEDMLAFARSFT